MCTAVFSSQCLVVVRLEVPEFPANIANYLMASEMHHIGKYYSIALATKPHTVLVDRIKQINFQIHNMDLPWSSFIIRYS